MRKCVELLKNKLLAFNIQSVGEFQFLYVSETVFTFTLIVRKSAVGHRELVSQITKKKTTKKKKKKLLDKNKPYILLIADSNTDAIDNI